MTSPDNFLRYTFTYNNLRAQNGLILYIPKDLYNYSCGVTQNIDGLIITDEYGNDNYYEIGIVTGNAKWYDTILDGFSKVSDFIFSTIGFIINSFNNLLVAIKDFGSNIASSISNITVLTAPITFIGDNVTLFFTGLPVTVQNTFIFVFTVIVLAIIIKLMM